jgi:hypothetical protein
VFFVILDNVFAFLLIFFVDKYKLIAPERGIKMHWLNAAGLTVGSIGIFIAISTGRDYIALHSDAQISAHMQRSVKVMCGLIGPCLYLFAEMAGCHLNEIKPADCTRLESTNWATVFQFLSSALFYLGTEISNQHLSLEDMIALRNVDAGYVVR